MTIFLAPVPELVIGMLACRRLGVAAELVHPMVGDGALREALAGGRVVLTSSAAVYRGQLHFLKERVDDAVGDVDRIVVADRTGWMPLGPTLDVYHDVPMRPGRDEWFPKIAEGAEPVGDVVEAPSLREIVDDPACLNTNDALLLYEGYLEPTDAAYVGASGTSLGSRPGGRLS